MIETQPISFDFGPRKLVVPAARENYWDFPQIAGEEEKRYDSFKASLQQEAELQVPRMSLRFARFFDIPLLPVLNTLPSVSISDTVAGGTASHKAQENTIHFPIKYAVPLFLGQTDSLRGTQFYPTLGHEVGHAVQMAAITDGRTTMYEDTYNNNEPIALEFFARICERLIADDMKQKIPIMKRDDYAATDEHVGIALADEHYEEILGLGRKERQVLALVPTELHRYIPKEIIDNRREAIHREWEEGWERFRRRRR